MPIMNSQKYAIRVSVIDLRTNKPLDKSPYLIGPFDCESEADDYAMKWVETLAVKIGKPYRHSAHEPDSDYGTVEKDIVANGGRTIVRASAETIRMECPDWNSVFPPEEYKTDDAVREEMHQGDELEKIQEESFGMWGNYQ